MFARITALRYTILALFAGLLIAAAFEEIDRPGIFGLAAWQAHAVALAFCVLAVSVVLESLRHRERTAALKLRAEKDLTRALINSLPAAVALFDSAGAIRIANANFLGYSEAEARTKMIRDLVAPTQWPLMAETFQRAMTCGFAAGEFDLVHKGESHIPHVVRGARVLVDGAPCALGVAMDISERKEAERKLAASEEKYRQVMENIPEVVWSADARGAVTFVSPQIEALFQIPPSALYEKGLEALTESIDPEDKDTVQDALARLSSIGQPLDLEYRMGLSDGRTIWVSHHVLAGEHGNGERFTMGILSDISQRMEREKKLRRFAAIIESLDQAVVCATPDGLISDWNQGATRLLGYEPSEVQGKPLGLIYPADRIRQVMDVIDRVRHGETVEPFESRRVTKSGAVVDVSIIPSAIRDEAGRLIGFSSVATNITQLIQAREKLRLQSTALEAAANGIVITDAEGRIEWANPAFSSLTGYSLEECIGRNPRELLKSGKQDTAFYKRLWDTILAGDVWSGELINRKKDGRLYSEEMTIAPVRSAEGRIAHFVAVKQDVSQRKAAELALKEAEERYRAIFENAIVGIFRTSPDGKPLMINQALAEIHGYGSPEELIAKVNDVPRQLFADPGRFADFRRMIEMQGQVRGAEVVLLRRDGSRRTALVNLHGNRNAEGSISCHEGTLLDITDRKLAEDQASFLAYYDALTGLPNRTLLQDRLNQAIASARRANSRVAVAFLDLDRFKDINDSLGHSVGDLLLQQVSKRLCSTLRQECTIARIGGDEFILVIPGIQQVDEIIPSLERIMNAMRGEFAVSAMPLHVTCSIGISIFPENGSDAESLVKNADAAMYEAKESGRDNFRFFAAEMNQKAVDRLTIENKLRVALERNQFSLHYQPQVDISAGQVTGVEALLRWREPHLGYVPPLSFIPVAESSGLIVPIGDWVLRTACRQIQAWRTGGLNLREISINVSVAQLRRPDYVDRVRTILEETGIEPRSVQLEITESMFTSSASETRETVAKLRDLGISIAVDDFGTGYSNLRYLSDFRFSKLKIDRSFMQDVENNPRAAAIVKAIIRMAKSLDVGVLAEGVETDSQLAILRKYRCHEVQGFYFSKAVAAERIPSLVDRLQKRMMRAQERTREHYLDRPAVSPHLTSLDSRVS